jgi:hypothetical protein
MAFDCCEVCCLGGVIMWIINAVATQCNADASWIFFLWSVRGDNTEVCDLAAFGDCLACHKEAGVGAGGHVAVGTEALEKAAHFFFG